MVEAVDSTILAIDYIFNSAVFFLKMAEKNNKKRKPTARDWDKVRALYMREETLDNILLALPNIALTKSGIVAKMNKEGITERRKAMKSAVLDNLQENVEKEKIKVNQDCIHLFETGSKVINYLLSQYLAEVKQENIPKNKAKATAYNIDMLMSGVTKIQKGLRVCYGMDETGKLYEKEPEILVIEGLDTDKI